MVTVALAADNDMICGVTIGYAADYGILCAVINGYAADDVIDAICCRF